MGRARDCRPIARRHRPRAERRPRSPPGITAEDSNVARRPPRSRGLRGARGDRDDRPRPVPRGVDPLGDREGRAGRRGRGRAFDGFRALLLDLGGYHGSGSGPRRRARPDIARLLGQPLPGVPERPRPSSSSPTTWHRPTTVTWTPERVLALVTARGGPTSHTAILARSLASRRSSPARRPRPWARASSSRSTVGRADPSRDRSGEAAETTVKNSSPRGTFRQSGGPGRTAEAIRSPLLLNIGDASGRPPSPRSMPKKGGSLPHRVPLPRPPGCPPSASRSRCTPGVLGAMARPQDRWSYADRSTAVLQAATELTSCARSGSVQALGRPRSPEC